MAEQARKGSSTEADQQDKHKGQSRKGLGKPQRKVSSHLWGARFLLSQGQDCYSQFPSPRNVDRLVLSSSPPCHPAPAASGSCPEWHLQDQSSSRSCLHRVCSSTRQG